MLIDTRSAPLEGSTTGETVPTYLAHFNNSSKLLHMQFTLWCLYLSPPTYSCPANPHAIAYVVESLALISSFTLYYMQMVKCIDVN